MCLTDYLDWPDWQIEQVDISTTTVLITAKSITSNNVCPTCGQPSTRVHSYYKRRIADLPISTKSVVIHLTVRRFRCLNKICRRATFTEPITDFLPAYARRTKRLTRLLNRLGLALGGQAAAGLLPHLNIVAGRDTILRILRKEFVPSAKQSATVVGIDDWAKRKGMRYGAIVVDLEKGVVLDLLPDRSSARIAKWFKEHPAVRIVSRDRSRQIIEGIEQGAPQAMQVTDRFHLLQNLTDTVYKVIAARQKTVREVFRSEKPTSTSNAPADLQPTSADMRRWERIQQAHRLHRTGWTSLAIASEMGIHPKTVRRYLRMTDLQPVKRRNRRRLLDPYKPYLRQRWQAGCQRGITLYSEIKGQGYSGGMTQLRDYLHTLKENVASNVGVQSEFASKWRRLSLRRLAFVIGRPETDWQGKPWLIEGLGRLRKGDPVLAETIDLAREFTQAVVSQDVARFDNWLKRAKVAKSMPLHRFALGLESDLPAVRAALRLKWSNGPVEGKINRLKTLKRQMYGRANLDLLKIRLIGVQPP